MSAQPLLGRVIVIAGDEHRLAEVAAVAVDAGALVAVVSQSLATSTPATVRFRADPRDPGSWERIAMHVEQHLGPVDGVATDGATREVMDAVFRGDLARRGHGCVLTLTSADDAGAVLTRLLGMPPEAPSPPALGARDR